MQNREGQGRKQGRRKGAGGSLPSVKDMKSSSEPQPKRLSQQAHKIQVNRFAFDRGEMLKYYSVVRELLKDA